MVSDVITKNEKVLVFQGGLRKTHKPYPLGPIVILFVNIITSVLLFINDSA